MKVVIDIDSHEAIQDFGNRSPVGAYQFKSQDTVELEIYFVQGGVVQDFGSGFALKFGMIETGDPARTLLAYQTSFTYSTDAAGNVYYSGLINFNTAQMATAIGTSSSIPGTAEIRYQDSLSEIIHSINIPTIVYATILVETGVTPPGVSTGYPDASAIELLVHKNAVNGYAGLDAQGDLTASIIPVDTQTIVVNANGDIASAAILATTSANFTTPAANATVTVSFLSTSNLKANSYVRIPVAGYYIVQSVTNSTTAVLTNNGDPFNAASGVTITSGAVVLPAQAAAGGGSAGQGAYTTLTGGFTVPAVGATVSINVASTAWMPGSGYAVFIGNAGYYLISSITDATHVVVTNSGTAANQPPGSTIPSGGTITGAGPQGAAGATGASLSAYSSTTASFMMPAVSASVTIVVGNTGWVSAGQIIYVASAGYFQVSTVVNATTLSCINLNYAGNATASTVIASGSAVTPAGLQGPAGAGGAGLNAFTTLSANYSQPAVSSTVTVNVGSTAWMAVGQGIFIQGGGYYSVISISDLTHAIVTNLGGSSNAAMGSVITGTGTQTVTPAGIPGTKGVDAYTSTSANFTTPAAGSSATINVVATSWATVGQNVFIAGAGYYQVAAIISGTQISVTNLGANYGNTSGGTTINSGASVSPAGVIGPAGPPGSQGAAGRDGAYATIYTQYSISGTGGVSSPAQLVNDAAQGTNAYAIYQRDVSGNNLWAPIPTDNTTITVTAGKLTVIGGGGGGGAFDPATGLYVYDDFLMPSTTLDPRYGSQLNTGTVQTLAAYGQSNPALKILGACELATGTSASANVGGSLFFGSDASTVYPILYGLGALTWKTRVFIEGTLPASGISYFFRAGIGQKSGTFYGYSNTPIQGFFFEYDPAFNSGQWRVGYGTSSITYANTSVAVAGDTAYNLEIDLNAAWTSLVFKINGATVSTISSGFPTNVYGCPVWALGRGTGSSTSFKAAIDSWMINYAFTR